MNEFTSRDEQMTQNVATMAALGRFEKEFTVYGCVFFDNEQIIIAISESADRIFDWMYDIENKDQYVSTIHSASIRSLVPAGMENFFIEQAQQKLILSLRSIYPSEYFLTLQKAFQVFPTNQSFEPLEQMRYQLDGICNNEQLMIFQGLIEKAYKRKILKESSYLQLLKWVNWTKRDLEQQIIKKDKYEKDFFAFIYISRDQTSHHIVIDGNKANTYKKLEQKISQNYFVSNIITKKWYYNNTYTIIDAKNDCKAYLEQIFDLTYQSLLITIETLPTPINTQILDIASQSYRKSNQIDLLNNLKRQRQILHI